MWRWCPGGLRQAAGDRDSLRCRWHPKPGRAAGATGAQAGTGAGALAVSHTRTAISVFPVCQAGQGGSTGKVLDFRWAKLAGCPGRLRQLDRAAVAGFSPG